jgi:hypothetical protein
MAGATTKSGEQTVAEELALTGASRPSLPAGERNVESSGKG